MRKKVKSVGDGAFSGCSGLTKVDIGDLKNWCNIDFAPEDYGDSGSNVNLGRYVNPSNPLAYARKMVLNGKDLEELTIPSGITAIKNFTFNNCRRFDKVTIPASVVSIGEYNQEIKGKTNVEIISVSA